MKFFNLKTILRKLFQFINFRSMIIVTMKLFFLRKNRILFIFEGRSYSYGEVYRESKKYAGFFLSIRRELVNRGKLRKDERLRLGIYMENIPEYLFASFAAGLSNSILFAINSGFRGETLAGVIDQAKISFLIVNENSADEISRIVDGVNEIGRDEVFCAGSPEEAGRCGFQSLQDAIENSPGKIPGRCRPGIDNFSPVIVIYTSGTTGLPKGVPCTHIKLVGAGFVVRWTVKLSRKDRGYISMPLFHSNAWYIGILPQLIAGGSFVLKRKFSARAFEEDMLSEGVTFLNYVGQPLHYIIDALERKYGSGDAVEKALANHPGNRFRTAYGNGATVIDREKMMRYLGMEHIFEIYGSTEAVITTANKPGDPPESVGEAPKSVVILNEEEKECPPGIPGEEGRLRNYDEAVGEICSRTGTDNLRFEGYFDNKKATGRKFRNGYYHSGDLGHIRVINGKRYLYFNGRTDDWIRKDGENFSAENVLQYTLKIGCVDSAVAFGAPCPVADERVMIAIELREGAGFDPDEVYSSFLDLQKAGGMDPKWMPDYIRIIEKFPVTDTQKIVVRPYKMQHYNIEADPGMLVYYRERGDTTFHRLSEEKFLELKGKFRENGREELISK